MPRMLCIFFCLVSVSHEYWLRRGPHKKQILFLFSVPMNIQRLEISEGKIDLQIIIIAIFFCFLLIKFVSVLLLIDKVVQIFQQNLENGIFLKKHFPSMLLTPRLESLLLRFFVFKEFSVCPYSRAGFDSECTVIVM